VKHLVNAVFWVAVFGWLFGSEYLEYRREIECVDRQGRWVEPDGCKSSHCVGAKAKP
jgi:hypothetical protein